MNTHTFHDVRNGRTYSFEEANGTLTRFTLKAIGNPEVIVDTPGHPVRLFDVDVCIGANLCGLGSNHPELNGILGSIAARRAA